MGLISRVSSRTYRSKMQLFIRGTEEHVINAQSEQEIVEFVCSVEQAQASELMLSVGGTPLCFDNLKEDSTIDVAGKLLGGRVHGSLARAGKVKGQTPKVEKEEKTKKKTGRAMRRLKYNRRFVTEVPMRGGRRMGPNQRPK